MAIVAEQGNILGVAPACAALAVPRATWYRRQKPKVTVPAAPRTVPRAMSERERGMVLSMLNDDRFLDQPPAQVYATLLGEGKYVCSISTMYRVLRENKQIKERRD
jgi:putative transposase